MEKKETLDELQDKIKSLTRKKYQIIVDADALDKEIMDVSERIYESSPDYVKVVCFQCNGIGYIESDEIDSKGKKKKIKCQICGLRGFLWMRKYSEVVK